MNVFYMLRIIVAQLFFTRACIEDIKTTEIKDQEIYIFISALLFLNLLQFFYTGESNLITNLILNILVFGGFGFLLYFSGQWGLGDSFLLLSFGLLNVFSNILEILKWLIIIFSIGVFFIFLYSVLFVLVSKKIFSLSLISILSIFFSVFTLVFSILCILGRSPLGFLIFLLIFLYSSIPFLNDVKNFMIRRIKVNELKEGDVLLEFKVWRGITKDEINRLKKSGTKYVYIKEGVRYAPTFLICLILLIFELFFSISIFDVLSLEHFPVL